MTWRCLVMGLERRAWARAGRGEGERGQTRGLVLHLWHLHPRHPRHARPAAPLELRQLLEEQGGVGHPGFTLAPQLLLSI